MVLLFCKEKFEDTEPLNRRADNKRKKDKRTNKTLLHINLKIQQHEPRQSIRVLPRG
jgi:hypothetical protein